MSKPKIHISWSGGKDSAYALYKIIKADEFEIAGLHTVIEEDDKKVGIHNIKEELIEKQAKSLGLQLTKLYLKKKPLAYEKLMGDYYQKLKNEGVDYVMFGDIFLEDLKDFRESILQKSGVKGVYPIWQEDTIHLVKDFLNLKFKTILCAVDAKHIDEEWVGAELSLDFIYEHSNIDSCGENGEYHSYVVDGPIFKNPIKLVEKGKYSLDYTFNVKDEDGNNQVIEEKFYYTDLELS